MVASRRWVRLISVVAGVVALFLLVAIVPTWFRAWVAGLHAGTVAIRTLGSILALFGVALAVGLLGSAILPIRVALARRKGRSRPVEAKLLLLSLACLLAVGLTEGLAAGYERRASLPPVEPGKPAEAPDAEYPKSLPSGPPGELRVVVVGGSSARGVPFHPHLSIGEVLAWKLESVLPGRKGVPEVLAYGGSPLEGMHGPLKDLKTGPDILLIYSGHNEFQARFAWSRTPNYYDDDFRAPPELPGWERLVRRSATCRMILDAMEAQKISIPPPSRITRELIDRPCCTPRERADALAIFAKRVEGMVMFAERMGAIPVLVIPPGNDAGFEPSRSVLARATPKRERDFFAAEVAAARLLSSEDPEQALAVYRRLVDLHPEFAETHYRLARLLQARKEFEEARSHFLLARELDGMPMRCPSDFQQIYRDVAARHPTALLVDGPAVCAAQSEGGILDDPLFHDAHHPALRGHIALTQAVLDGLQARRAFGWPVGVPAPRITPAGCAEHFGLDKKAWVDVCEGTAIFFDRVAFIRYDPAARLAKKALNLRAAKQIAAGAAPETVGIPGLGTK